MDLSNVTVNTQSSIRIATTAGNLYFDPISIPDEPHDADVVFITHSHHDHFEPGSIRKIAKEETVYVLPESMQKEARALGAEEDHILLVKPGYT